MEGNGHVHDAGVIEPGALTTLDSNPATAFAEPVVTAPEDVATLLMTRLVIGVALLAVEALRAIVDRVVPGAERGPESDVQALLGELSSAMLGAAVDTERRAIEFTNAAVMLATPVVSFVASRPLLGFPLRMMGDEFARWVERGRGEQERGRETAAAFIRGLVPEVVRAVIEQIDVNAVVAEVDLDRVLDRVDLNRAIERVDVDAVIGRVDVNAVIDRVDLPGITTQVMDEVNIGEVIRESTGSVTTQAVDAVRFQGMSMDRFVARVIDRMLLRHGGRDASSAPPPAVEPTTQEP